MEKLNILFKYSLYLPFIESAIEQYSKRFNIFYIFVFSTNKHFLHTFVLTTPLSTFLIFNPLLIEARQKYLYAYIQWVNEKLHSIIPICI